MCKVSRLLPTESVPATLLWQADLPKELKETFSLWAKKELPEGAANTFKGWTCVNLPVLESNAVASLDVRPSPYPSYRPLRARNCHLCAY